MERMGRVGKQCFDLVSALEDIFEFEKQLDATIAQVNGGLVTFANIQRFMDKFTSCLVYKPTIIPYLVRALKMWRHIDLM